MNLVHFLALLVKYKVSFEYFRPGIIEEIKESLDDAGSVWLKFAQSMAQMKDIVPDDLARALEPLWYDCKIHDHEISKQIIRRELGDTYDVETMEFIGSGSMAQTYKVFHVPTATWVCVKVMHPGAPEEIRDAVRTYDAVKDSFLFPSQFQNICWMFFESLKTQVDFKTEYEMGMKIRAIYQRINLWYDGDRTKPVVVVPEPIAYTDSCLVMAYEESFRITWSTVDNMCAAYDPLTVCFVLRVVHLFIALLNIREKIIHLDLHPGNVGFRVNGDGTWNVLLYDMGQSVDIRESTDPLFDNAPSDYLNGWVQKLSLEMTHPDTHPLVKREIAPGRLRGKEFTKNIEHGMVSILKNDYMVLNKNMYWIVLSNMKSNSFTYMGFHVRSSNAIPNVDNCMNETDTLRTMFPNGSVGSGLVVDFTEYFKLSNYGKLC